MLKPFIQILSMECQFCEDIFISDDVYRNHVINHYVVGGSIKTRIEEIEVEEIGSIINLDMDEDDDDGYSDLIFNFDTQTDKLIAEMPEEIITVADDDDGDDDDMGNTEINNLIARVNLSEINI